MPASRWWRPQWPRRGGWPRGRCVPSRPTEDEIPTRRRYVCPIMRLRCHRRVMEPEECDRIAAETCHLDIRIFTAADGLTVGHLRLTDDGGIECENLETRDLVDRSLRLVGTTATWCRFSGAGASAPSAASLCRPCRGTRSRPRTTRSACISFVRSGWRASGCAAARGSGLCSVVVKELSQLVGRCRGADGEEEQPATTQRPASKA